MKLSRVVPTFSWNELDPWSPFEGVDEIIANLQAASNVPSSIKHVYMNHEAKSMQIEFGDG